MDIVPLSLLLLLLLLLGGPMLTVDWFVMSVLDMIFLLVLRTAVSVREVDNDVVVVVCFDTIEDGRRCCCSCPSFCVVVVVFVVADD
jgi:hypothetical protein